jgi:hypothetical protein
MRPSAKVDNTLKDQLDRARNDAPVTAVCTVKTGRGQDPAAVDDIVRRIVEDAQAKTGAAAIGLAVFANLGSFSVSGPSALIRCILADRKVTTATAASPSEDVLIRPVRRKRVNLDDDKY